MLIDWSVLDLVHLIELTFEKNKFFTTLRFGVHDTLLILLESVNNLHEVTLVQKELEVFGITFLYDIQNPVKYVIRQCEPTYLW